MNIAIKVICVVYFAFSAFTVILALSSYLNIDWWPFGRKGKKQ